jgi:hypothetical protein
MFHIHGQASKPPLLFPIEFCRMQIYSGSPAMHIILSADLTTRRAGKSCSSCLLLVRIIRSTSWTFWCACIRGIFQGLDSPRCQGRASTCLHKLTQMYRSLSALRYRRRADKSAKEVQVTGFTWGWRVGVYVMDNTVWNKGHYRIGSV